MKQTQIQIDTEKLLRTFLDLVRIDSPSGAEEQVRIYLEQRLKDLEISFKKDSVGNLIAKVPALNSKSSLKLIMTAHMDVVPPCINVQPVIEGEGDSRVIRSSGTTVLGADDKSGLAVIMEVLELSLKLNLPRPNLILIFTTQEETTLQGAKYLDPSFYSEADFAIALDHSGEQGMIVNEAPTHIKFNISVHGTSTHAGIMPEKGINAIQLLCQALSKIKFGRLDSNTTSNIGFIKGGKATNIVPDLATAEGEIRGHNDLRLQDEINMLKKMLHETVNPIKSASFDLNTEISFKRYHTNPEDRNVQLVMQAMSSLGLPVNIRRSNGGSDLNVFSEHGIPGIVLSAGYSDPHSLNESVSLREMTTCMELVLSIWEHFANS